MKTAELSWAPLIAVFGAFVMLAGIFGYFSLRARTSEEVAVQSSWLIERSGPALVNAWAADEKHPAFQNLAAFLGLSEFDSHINDTGRSLSAESVPIPLIPGESGIRTLCRPLRSGTGAVPLVPYDNSVDQVILFIPTYRRALSDSVNAYLSRAGSKEFVCGSIHFGRAEEGANDCRRFFEIAEALWKSAQSGDRSSFNAAARSFSSTDTFACTGFRMELALSGRQLELMHLALGGQTGT